MVSEGQSSAGGSCQQTGPVGREVVLEVPECEGTLLVEHRCDRRRCAVARDCWAGGRALQHSSVSVAQGRPVNVPEFCGAVAKGGDGPFTSLGQSLVAERQPGP